MAVPPELTIDRAIGRLTYVRHWRDEYQQLDEAYRELGVTAMGAADREEWLAIQDFQHRVSDLMAWVADVQMPRGAAAIERLQS